MAKRFALKDGVIFAPRIELMMSIPTVMTVYESFAPQVTTLVCTSGCDGVHMAGSKHYENLALDWRIWGISEYIAGRIVDTLNQITPGMQFILEWKKNHIHQEYDPQ
jgi:hypothetical protein